VQGENNCDGTMVKKHHFAPFLSETHHFTQTGSGQTSGKLKKRVALP
jgi:hypothetical protein